MATNNQQHTSSFPGQLHYPVYNAAMQPHQKKERDYFTMGLILCLPVFLIVALVLTILSVTILYRWIPQGLLMAIMLIASIASLFGTLSFFSRLDKKQQKNRTSPYSY